MEVYVKKRRVKARGWSFSKNTHLDSRCPFVTFLFFIFLHCFVKMVKKSISYTTLCRLVRLVNFFIIVIICMYYVIRTYSYTRLYVHFKKDTSHVPKLVNRTSVALYGMWNAMRAFDAISYRYMWDILRWWSSNVFVSNAYLDTHFAGLCFHYVVLQIDVTLPGVFCELHNRCCIDSGCNFNFDWISTVARCPKGRLYRCIALIIASIIKKYLPIVEMWYCLFEKAAS